MQDSLLDANLVWPKTAGQLSRESAYRLCVAYTGVRIYMYVSHSLVSATYGSWPRPQEQDKMDTTGDSSLYY